MYMKHMLKRVITAILVTVCTIVTAVNAVIIIDHFAEPNHIAGFFGYKPVIVLSGSMEPLFYPGDLILIKAAKAADTVAANDVICYRQDDHVVTHRVVGESAVSSGQYITQGDANNTEDAVSVAADQIEGFYTGLRIPRLGSFALFAASSTGMILFVVVPLILFFVLKMRQKRVQIQQREEENDALKNEIRQLKEHTVPLRQPSYEKGEDNQ